MQLARWMHHNFLPVRLLTDVERRGRVPLPKVVPRSCCYKLMEGLTSAQLPRLGEPLAANVKRSLKDTKFLEAKRLYKGTPGKVPLIYTFQRLIKMMLISSDRQERS